MASSGEPNENNTENSISSSWPYYTGADYTNYEEYYAAFYPVFYGDQSEINKIPPPLALAILVARCKFFSILSKSLCL